MSYISIIRYYFLLGSLIMALFTKAAHTQESQKPPSMAISANIAGPIFGHYEMDFSYRITTRVAITVPLTVHYTPASFVKSDVMGDFDFHSLEIGIGAKIFIVGDALSTGIYIEPVTEGGYLARVGINKPTIVIKESLRVGYRFVFDSGLSVDFLGGILFNYLFDTNRLTKEPSEKVERTRVFPVLKVLVGYAW